MQVRAETPSDYPEVRRVVEVAFGRAAEAILVDRLRSDGDAVLAAVAIERKRLVGHVMFSKMIAPFRALGMAPVSVVPDRRRLGIGSRLIRWGLAQAAQTGWQGVFVLGDPALYQRFGFDPTLGAGFTSRYGGPSFMALSLAGPLPVRTGRIEYPRAFEA